MVASRTLTNSHRYIILKAFFLHLYHWFSCILGERPYKCNLCPKAFADKSNLRAHTQTHSNSKPFECRHCGKTFALKSYLYKHEEASCNQSKWRKRLNFHYFLRSWIKHLFKNEYHDIFSFQILLYKNRYTRGAKWSRKKRNASRYNNVHRGKNQGSLFNSRSTKVLKPSEVKHVLLYLWDLTQNMSLMFLQHVSFLLALPHDSCTPLFFTVFVHPWDMADWSQFPLKQRSFDTVDNKGLRLSFFTSPLLENRKYLGIILIVG